MQWLLGMQGRLFVTLGFVAVDQWPDLPGLCPHWQTASFLTGLLRYLHLPADCVMDHWRAAYRECYPVKLTQWSAFIWFALGQRAIGTCCVCSVPYCSFYDSHLISTKFVIAERYLKRAFPADFSQVEKRRMSWDLILRRATSWYLLIRHQGTHRNIMNVQP